MHDGDLKLLERGIELLGTTNDLNEQLTNLVKLAVDGARAKSGSLYMLDAEKNVLKPAVVVGLPEDYVRGCGEVAVGDQCCGRAVEHKKPWVVADMHTDPLFANARGASEASGIRAGFSVPVLDGDGVLGSLACHYTKPFRPSEYDIERNRVFATLIGFAIAKHRAEAPAKRKGGAA